MKWGSRVLILILFISTILFSIHYLMNPKGKEISGRSVGNMGDTSPSSTDTTNKKQTTTDESKPTLSQVVSETDAADGNRTSNEIVYLNQGNLQNNGYIVAGKSSEIYSLNSLNVLTEDGNTKISNDVGSHLNYEKNKIYYINKQDSHVYEISEDGREKKMISADKASFVYQQNGWLYYTNISDGNHLYKIKTDGTARTKLNNELSINPYFTSEWIFFRGDKGGLTRSNLDGTNKTVLNQDSCMFINVVGEWIYFIDFSKEKNIYRLNFDGSKMEPVIKEHVISSNADSKWLYYSVQDKGIFKMRIQDGQITQLTETKGYSINLTNDRLYFISDPEQKIMSMKKDGSDLKVIEEKTPPIQVSNEVKEKAISTVINELIRVKDKSYIPDVTAVEIAEVKSDGKLIVHVYNYDNNKTETLNWYTYDPKTGSVTVMFQ